MRTMYTFTINEKTVSIFPSSEANAPIIYLNTFSGEVQKVYEATQTAGCPPFTLVAVSDLDWNHDMAPWDSPPTFKNADSCTGGADDYLRLLTEEIIPAAEKELGGVPRWRGITGYSLAGLFALYAIYQTDLFSRVGSMSGSLWFPGMRSTSSPMSQRAGRIVYTFLWEIRRAKPRIRSCARFRGTPRRYALIICAGGSTQCSI